ncbi:MAG: ComF family protein [Bacteroidaceae bacterium]|nr:ComF family protein [Bacteroidaceae bacterium]
MERHRLARYARAAWHLLFPERCALCGSLLGEGEEAVCATCRLSLPYTRLRARAGNAVERLFYDLDGLQRASAYLIYREGNDVQRLVLLLKYHARPRLGRYLGRDMAYDLDGTGFFDGVDGIVPVPLHFKKEHQRGYNQSLHIALGLADVTGIPVRTDLIVRTVNNPTQTQRNHRERRENVKGVFRIKSKEAVAGGHWLLVDDVITTGATLHSCAEALVGTGDVRFSVLGLSLAGMHLNVFEERAE